MDDDEYNVNSDIDSETEYEETEKPKNNKNKNVLNEVREEEIDEYDEEELKNDDSDIEEDEVLEDSDQEEDVDDTDDEDGEESILEKIKTKSAEKSPFMNLYHFDTETDDPEEEEDDEQYLQKIDDTIEKNIISEFHPELLTHNNDEIETMCRIVRNENGVIIDPLHKTIPFITRYEKARILGERAKQLNCGAQPMVAVEPTVLDGYLIALKEFEEKKIPFIVKRPLPNGGCEYWRLSDLEILS
jgi:DNA-directed RNA polymerase I, II, and III subunit RPABC2